MKFKISGLNNLSKKSQATLYFLISILLCSCLLFTLINFNSQLYKKTHAESADLSPVEILENYSPNTLFSVPAAKLKLGNTEYDAEHILFFPDGSAYSLKEIVLTQEGEYKLEYFKSISGKKYSIIKSFTVLNETYSFTGSRSSANFGQSSKKPDVPEAYGINVSLSGGEQFLYNEIIDLSNLKKTQALIELIITPIEKGQIDAKDLYIRLTDPYDETNTVTIWYYADGTTQVYAKARADKVQKQYVGTQKNTSYGDYIYNNQAYKVFTNSYGSNFSISFTDTPNANAKKQEILTLSMDYAEKRLFSSNNNADALNDPKHLTALADPVLYGDDLWEGFTDGKAKLSIWASRYSQSSFNFTIKSIAGKDLSQKHFDVTNDKPLISIDTDLSNILPAKAGGTYPVFPATAVSGYDKSPKIIQKVFYSYSDINSKIQIGIDNGRFETKYSGVYTIEYTAIDKFGSISIKTLDIVALPASSAINLSIANSGNDVGNVGQDVLLRAPNITSANGDYELKVIARHKTNSEIVFEIEDFTFIPLYIGDYEIEYVVSDYTNIKTIKYNIAINTGSQHLVIYPEGLPKYFMQGMKYNLSAGSGYEFNQSGFDMKGANTLVREFDINNQLIREIDITNKEYTVGACNSLEVIYKLGQSESSKIFPVINTKYTELGHLDMTKYFQPVVGQFQADAQSQSIAYITNIENSVNGKASIEFINELLAENLAFRFNVDPEKSAYSQINVYLTDSINKNQVLKLSYIDRIGGSTAFSINDQGRYSLEASFSSLSIAMGLNYSDITKLISPEIGKYYEATSYYQSDEEFVGFSSGRIYVEVELEGIKGESSVIIRSFNGQILSNLKFDYSKPYFEDNAITEVKKIGSIATIKSIRIADVLSPYVKYSFSVIAPSGEYVSDVDGTLLKDITDLSKDYSIKLMSIGSYRVEYNAADLRGNDYKRNPYGFIIRVNDLEAPIISIASKKVTEAKINTQIKIADCTATDNMTENPVLYTILKNPVGVYSPITDGVFVPTMKGIYTVYYYALDEAGNTSVKTYEITVTK